jgi:hypothetical protein
MSDFYSKLRSKLSKHPSARSDQAFWSRFESEFGTSSRRHRWIWILAPGALAAALVLTFSLVTVERSAVMDAPELAEHELLEEYELLADFDDIELTEENVNFLTEGS